jgi:drug/metabolite transporter (DMT)-like permease
MNMFKALVALVCISVVLTLGQSWYIPSTEISAQFAASGFLGLFIGDIFLLKAYTRLGASRTLILFGFQPLLIGFFSYLLFSQPLAASKLIAILFLFSCLYIFSLEKFREHGHWEIKGLVYALLGMLLDTVGLLISRSSFDSDPLLGPLQGNFFRLLGALFGFVILNHFKPIGIISNFLKLNARARSFAVGASFAGTFLSLFLYLTAVKTGHLASVSGVALSGPILAAIVECWIVKKRPSRYLITAIALFAVGASILILS